MSLRAKTLEEVLESYPNIRIYGYGKLIRMITQLIDHDFISFNSSHRRYMSETIMDTISWETAPPDREFWQEFYDSLTGRKVTSSNEFNNIYRAIFLSIFAKEDYDDKDGETDEDY